MTISSQNNSTPEGLKYVFQILHSNNCHYLNHVIIDSEVYGVRATRTSSISGFYVIRRFKCEWSFGNNFKIVKKSVKVLIRLSYTKIFDSKMMNANQVLFGCNA
jgi:hypothetical protein